jgi:class 3 adenylate cyclase
MRVDPVRYCKAGDVAIAYQVYGDGDVPVIGIPGAASCLEVVWDWPAALHYFERWGSFATVAHFDKRGTGSSDRIIGAPSVDDRMEDIHAVMDAAGFETAAIYGISEGGPLAVLFAVTYPERTRALVLQGTFAWGGSSEEIEQLIELWTPAWGTPDTVTPSLVAPSQIDNPAFVPWLNRYERTAATPSTLASILRLVAEIDVRHVLELVQCPTLVLHARGDRLADRTGTDELLRGVPDVRLYEYDSEYHFPIFDRVDEQLDVIEEFLTGRAATGPVDRVLATVLFTDIVGSTEHAAREGDTRWRALLDQHDRMATREVERGRGRVVKHTGDGMLATFDSPARAIRCASACAGAARSIGVEVRAGLHTGEVELRGDDVAGIAVHLAARVAALADAGQVLVSGAVPPLVVGSGIQFESLGEHTLKGIPGEWQVSAAVT